MTERERGARRREMARWLGRRDREGLTWRELSERSGIPIPTLVGWRKRIERESCGPRARRLRFAEVHLREDGKGREEPAATDAVYEIESPSGLRLRLREGFDLEAVARLVEVLDRRC